MTNLKYFSHIELQDPQTKEVKLADGFGRDIDMLRGACRFPLKVNSCCRSAQYNDATDGHPKSLHVYDKPAHPTGGTCAIDIDTSMLDGTQKARLIEEALFLQFSILIGRNFMHLDTRSAVLDMKRITDIHPSLLK